MKFVLELNCPKFPMDQRPVFIPLELVLGQQEHLESPSPLAGPSPLLVSPVGIQNCFLGWFLLKEIQSLEEWARAVRAPRGEAGFNVSEPEVSNIFRSVLRFLLCHQWEFMVIKPPREDNSSCSVSECTDIICLLVTTGSSASSLSPRDRRLSGRNSSIAWWTRLASSLWSRT